MLKTQKKDVAGRPICLRLSQSEVATMSIYGNPTVGRSPRGNVDSKYIAGAPSNPARPAAVPSPSNSARPVPRLETVTSSRARRRSGLLSCASGQKSPVVSNIDGGEVFVWQPLTKSSSPFHETSSYDSGVDVKSTASTDMVDDRRPTNNANCSKVDSKQTRKESFVDTTLPRCNCKKTERRRSKKSTASDDSENNNISESKCEVSSTSPSDQRPTLWRSISTFSLKSLSRSNSTRRKSSQHMSESSDGESVASRRDSSTLTRRDSTLVRIRRKLGGSVPGDARLGLTLTDSSVDSSESLNKKKRSRLGGSFRRSKSRTSDADKSTSPPPDIVPRTHRSTSDISETGEPTSRRGSKSSRKALHKSTDCLLELNIPSTRGDVKLVKILKLDRILTNRWISGLAVSDKNELLVVDLRAAYLVDQNGGLIRTIGLKGSERIVEPIGVATTSGGHFVFSDHADQSIKMYSSRGHHIQTVRDLELTNIAGVACDRVTGDVFIAGTDRKKILVHSRGGIDTIPSRQSNIAGLFQHPYSVAFSHQTGDIIVGDDHDQSVKAVSKDGQQTWCFRPPATSNADERQFFPSSVCVDHIGNIFVADLYNQKIYMIDASGRYLKTLLSRTDLLEGNPGAIATDGRGHLYVADEEKTVKVFRYDDVNVTSSSNSRRFSYCHISVNV